MKDRSAGVQIAFTLVPIVVSLLIGALLVLAVGKNPLEVFERVFEFGLLKAVGRHDENFRVVHRRHGSAPLFL